MKPMWCEFVCRSCSTTGPGAFTYGAIPRAALWKKAQRAGWRYSKALDDCFCSTTCLKIGEGRDVPLETDAG